MPEAKPTCPPEVLQVEVKRSVDEIDAEAWNGLVANHDRMLAQEVLAAIEHSRLENASHWYLTFYDRCHIVAVAVLSEFEVSLDLLLSRRIQKLVAKIRNVWSSFLRIRILFCGLPLSVGRSALAIPDKRYQPAVVKKLVETMQELAELNKTRYMCLKEFTANEMSCLGHLRELGFFKAYSIPKMTFHLNWSDYPTYLQSMRHNYRRMILKNLKKLGLDHHGPVLSHPTAVERIDAELRLVSLSECSPLQFHRLYSQVIHRAEHRLEILNESFFEKLYEALGYDLEILAVISQGRIIGSALLIADKGSLAFLLAGLDYERRDAHDVYMNLLHGIVALAFERKCEIVDLGQTCYWLKQRIGATPEEMCFWFRAKNRSIHMVLSTLSPVFFPKTSFPRLRVFRDQP